jgi:hypothetical protein
MATTTVPHPTTRFERGITLAQEHFEEITCIAPYVWSVPSCTGSGVYACNLKTGECSCPDRVAEGERCKHQHAARYVKARTAICSGCSKRFRHQDLYPVPWDHLTFFENELVCEECALAHGVL